MQPMRFCPSFESDLVDRKRSNINQMAVRHAQMLGIIHRITEWFKDHLVPTPTMGRDTSHYTRLPKAPSSPAFNTSRDGAMRTILAKQ